MCVRSPVVVVCEEPQRPLLETCPLDPYTLKVRTHMLHLLRSIRPLGRTRRSPARHSDARVSILPILAHRHDGRHRTTFPWLRTELGHVLSDDGI